MEIKCILCAIHDKKGIPDPDTQPVIGNVQTKQPQQSNQIINIIKAHHAKVHA
jgi:hypothetical protein